MLPSGSPSVQRLDVTRVQAERVGAVLDDLVELVEVCVAYGGRISVDKLLEIPRSKGERTCRAVAVENGLLLALDRLGVELNGLGELLCRVRLVASTLEVYRKLLPLLLKSGVSDASSAPGKANKHPRP